MLSEQEKKQLLLQVKEELDRAEQAERDGEFVDASQNYGNAATSYNGLGDEKNCKKYLSKALEVIKMMPAEERVEPFWYSDYFNLIGTMFACSKTMPSLKTEAVSIAKESLSEFDYNTGAVGPFIATADFNDAMPIEEMEAIALKGIQKFEINNYDDKWGIYICLRDIYQVFENEDSDVKSACLDLMNKCAEADEDVANDLKDLLG